MKFAILGQGTALPEHSIGMEEAVLYAKEAFCSSDEQARQLKLLYRMTGVKRRHTVVLDAPEGTPNRQSFFPNPNGTMQHGPSIRCRMERYEQDALPLALKAAREALAKAGTNPEDITHLVTVSCSGFAAPGVDIGLIKGLGLKSTAERVHVGFMGCHGALNG
ncbi:MAG: type III polyketide synthase, partial [Candidatus Hydrogenedentes bacterium]|nr:type III polyketide synthase [Candidatus Hydrogenedentota bacterium]